MIELTLFRVSLFFISSNIFEGLIFNVEFTEVVVLAMPLGQSLFLSKGQVKNVDELSFLDLQNNGSRMCKFLPILIV